MKRSADMSAAILVRRQDIEYLGARSNQRQNFNMGYDLHDSLRDYRTGSTLVTIKKGPSNQRADPT